VNNKLNVQCAVCHEKNYTIHDSVMSVYECKDCTHQFTILNPEEQEPYLQEYFSETHKNWFAHPDITLYDSVIKKVAKPKIKVLDVGCGTGSFLKHFGLKKKDVSLYGIDLIKNEHDGISFIQGDFDTFKFDSSFDVIVGFMVVEHMPDPRAFVQKIHTLLNPNGIVVLNTINSSSLMYNLANLFRYCNWRGPCNRLYDHHHLQHYSLKSFKRLIKGNGFEVLDHWSHNFPLAAVDVPNDNGFMQSVYKIGVSATFGMTQFFGEGINQTIIAKKNSSF
jgi:SAM-dependent methyltransferase